MPARLPPSAPPPRWSEDQVRRFVERARLGYQNVQLPYGYEMGGHDRSSTAELIFPTDMTGKTVLDVGSFNGYFCLEALRRGAERAVGVEVSPVFAEQARQIADCLGASAEYLHADIERDLVGGPFDYVLCLNVLHHMRDPIQTLEKLAYLARERLILEVASTGVHDRKKIGASWLEAFFLGRLPVILPLGRERQKSGQTFLFTPRAVEYLLRFHLKLFATVHTRPSPFKDRFLVVAEKRRVKHLVVVSGPLALAKAALIGPLKAGRLPRLEEPLGLGDLAAWESLQASKLEEWDRVETERLLYYYDFLHPYFKSARTHDRDDQLDLLEGAQEVTFLTFWAPPEVLHRQLRQLEAEIAANGDAPPRSFSSHYQDPSRIEEYYRRWVEFCDRRPGRHLLVTLHPEPRIYTSSEWRALHQRA